MISLIIPTHNRLPSLQRVLKSIAEKEDLSENLEVLVVDDGSSDGTYEALQTQTFPFPFKVFRQPPSGPARARNRGVEEAQGEGIIFIGDDTRLHPQCLYWLTRCWEEAGKEKFILGTVVPDPQEKPTQFMLFIHKKGLQFGYDLIKDPEDVAFNFFYTSCILVPKEAFQGVGGFDETFPFAAWEDIEWAYRAFQKGWKMRWCQKAMAYHQHRITFKSFIKRQEKSGRAAWILIQKHPELEAFVGLPLAKTTPIEVPVRIKVLTFLLTLLEPFPLSFPRFWRYVLEYHYLRGMALAMANHYTQP